MSEIVRKLNNKSICIVIIFSLTTIWTIRYSTSELYNYFALIEAIMALILIVTESKQKLKTGEALVLSTLVLFAGGAVCLILVLSSEKILDMKYLGVLCIYLSPIVFFQWLQRKKDIYLQRTLLYIAFCIWGYYGIKQIIFYSLHAGAARHLAADPLYYGKLAIGGGYFFAYGSAILAVYFLERLCFIKKSLNIMVLFLICFIHVLTTESMLTTMSMLLGIGLVILKVIAKKMRLSLFSIFILIMGSISVLFFSGAFKIILMEVYDYFSVISRPYAWRIVEIIDLLLGNGVVKEGAIQLRWAVYKESIDKILEYPLTGSLLSGRYFGGGGGHSEVLDALAQWGVMVGGIYIYIYMAAIKNIYKWIDCRLYLFPCGCMLLLNPVAIFHFSFCMFFMIPLQQVLDRKMGICE
ncbi:hypothetical protein D7X98_18215 [bacterium 1XD8-76]|nr:hypothetical protein D7X98_18215 [bacterium 1XD8-76]